MTATTTAPPAHPLDTPEGRRLWLGSWALHLTGKTAFLAAALYALTGPARPTFWPILGLAVWVGCRSVANILTGRSWWTVPATTANADAPPAWRWPLRLIPFTIYTALMWWAFTRVPGAGQAHAATRYLLLLSLAAGAIWAGWCYLTRPAPKQIAPVALGTVRAGAFWGAYYPSVVTVPGKAGLAVGLTTLAALILLVAKALRWASPAPAKITIDYVGDTRPTPGQVAAARDHQQALADAAAAARADLPRRRRIALAVGGVNLIVAGIIYTMVRPEPGLAGMLIVIVASIAANACWMVPLVLWQRRRSQR